MKKISIKAREGSSLIIVICVSAFLMAFGLAMIYTAGLSLSRANRRLEQEQSYQLAQSFSEVLEQELTRYAYPLNSQRPKPGDSEYDSMEDFIAPENTFYQYVVKFLEGQYGEYDPEHPDETIYHFTAGQASGGADAKAYGNIRVSLYKEAEEVQMWETLTFEALNSNSRLDDIETNPIQRYVFTVAVIVDTEDGVSFTYETQYQQMVQYKVEYTYNGSTIVRSADNKWHEGNLSGPVIELNDTDMIQYKYQAAFDNIKSCTFHNAFKKKGDVTP